MPSITVATGTKQNAADDITILSKKWMDNPHPVIATEANGKDIILEITSTLFLEDNLVLVLLDPSRLLIEEMKEHLLLLSQRIHILIYCTAPSFDVGKLIKADKIDMEKEGERRIDEMIKLIIRKHGKKMTHEALSIFKERIKDGMVVESEVMKLINFIGDRKEIRSTDVRELVTDIHEDTMISLFNALMGMNKREVLETLNNIQEHGTHILALHSFLVRQTRLLLHAKDMEKVFKGNPEYAMFLKTFNKWKESLDLKPKEKKHYLTHQTNPHYAYRLSQTSQRVTKKNLISFFHILAAFDIKVKKGTKYEQPHFEAGLLEF